MSAVEASVAAVAIVLAAGIFRGLTGYGFSLVAALGLPHLIDVETAISAILLLEVLTALVMLQRASLTQRPDHTVVALVLSGLAGSVPGAFLSGIIGQHLTVMIVNLSLVAASLAAFVQRPQAWLRGTGASVVVGLLVAVLLSGFAVGGPLLIAWLIATQVAPNRARAAITLFFLVTALSAVVLRAFAGSFPLHALWLALGLAPAAVAGVSLGRAAFSRMRPQTWRSAVHVSLAGIAALAALNVVLSLARVES